MGIKIEDGTLKVSASYSLKEGLPNYSSHDAYAGYSIEIPVEGEEAAILVEGQKLYDTLSNAAKLSVFATLNVAAEADADGILQPVLQAKAAPAVAAPAPAAPAPQNNGGGGQYPPSKPAADTSNLPQFQADLDGRGVDTWIDLRPLKDNGTYKQGAADFRSNSDRKRQVWLKDKNGNVKQNVAQALQAAGQTV